MPACKAGNWLSSLAFPYPHLFGQHVKIPGVGMDIVGKKTFRGLLVFYIWKNGGKIDFIGDINHRS